MDNEWPSLIPLEHRKKPPFPIEALPERVQKFASALADSCQVPIDLPGCLILAVGAATIAKRLKIKLGHDWTEPANLYIAVALPPANRKSGIFKEIVRPLVEIEKDEIRRVAPQIKAAEQDKKIWEAKLKKAEKIVINASLEEEKDAAEEFTRIKEQEPKIPKVQRLLADDATPEKLITIISENEHERIAIMSAEGGVFDMMGGKYSNSGPNLDVYLKAHPGDSIRVDRHNRAPDFVDEPALTIGITIQPDVINGLIEKPGFRGRGLLGRFLYSIPESFIGHRQIDMPGVLPVTRMNYLNTIKRLYKAAHELPSYHAVNLNNDAKKVFRQFQKEVEASLAPGCDLYSIPDWGGKLSGAVARIALILHALKYPEAPEKNDIDLETMNNAISLGDYFKNQALATFELMGSDPIFQKARKTIEWFCRHECMEFTQRELHQALRAQFKFANELVPVLALLVERGYIMPIPITKEGAGRNPSPLFAVNPHMHTQNTHFTQN